MKRVHLLRAELGSIMVGAGTVLSDDPKLTVKEDHVQDPPELLKIVVDGKGRIPAESRFLRTPGQSFVVTGENCDKQWLDKLSRAIEDDELEAEIIILKDDEGMIELSLLMEELAGMGVEAVLVEGGSSMIWHIVSQGLADRMTIYYGPMMIGGQGPTIVGGEGSDGEPIQLKIEKVEITEDGGMLVTLDRE